eukprot:GHVU01156033.1.p1 GENE.GHVU01156033.1~~GHVU01156033.1.p1  ORF type:complete len:884 (+),score=152.02 GHVU01156033.1:214-2865(+)
MSTAKCCNCDCCSECSCKKCNCLKLASKWISEQFDIAFTWLGLQICKLPWVFIFVPCLVSSLLAIGALFWLQTENDVDLFTPDNVAVLPDIGWMFTSGYTDSTPRIVNLHYVMQDVSENVLTKANLLDMYDVYNDVIKNVAATCEMGSCKGQNIDFDTAVLTGYNNNRMVESPLDYFDMSRAQIEAVADQTDLIAKLNDKSKTHLGSAIPIVQRRIFGNVTRDGSGNMVGATTMTLRLQMRNRYEDVENKRSNDYGTAAWELAYDEAIATRASETDKEGIIWPDTNEGQSNVRSASIRRDIPFASLGYLVIGIFAMYCMGHRLWKYSHIWIGLTLLLVVGFGFVGALGLLQACRLPFSYPIAAAPLLCFGLGVDDAFVILAAYQQQEGETVEERVSKALGRAGSAITVTTITDVAAFLSGLSSSLPALRAFVTYAAVGLIFTYIFVILVFTAILAYDAKREMQNQADGCCCLRVDDATPLWNGCGCLCCGRLPLPKDEDHREPLKGPTNATPNPGQYALAYFEKVHIPVVSHWAGKTFSVLVVCAILGVSIWGLTLSRMRFSTSMFIPEGHWYHYLGEMKSTYYDGDATPTAVFTRGEGDYSQEHPRIVKLVHDVANLEGIVHKYASESSWVLAFDLWLQQQTLVPGWSYPTDNKAYADEVKRFLNSNPVNKFHYEKDIKFNGDGTIHSTRSRILLVDQVEAMDWAAESRTLRDFVTDRDVLGSTVISISLMFYEGYSIMSTDMYIGVVISSCCVFVVIVILLADIWAALIVFFCVALVNVSLLGMMYFFNIFLNSISIINVTIAVGIAVDYAAHIMHAFLHCPGERPDRVKSALREMGPSVLHGGVSTFLGVVFMSGAESIIFKYFFVQWSWVVLMGLFTGE